MNTEPEDTYVSRKCILKLKSNVFIIQPDEDFLLYIEMMAWEKGEVIKIYIFI